MLGSLILEKEKGCHIYNSELGLLKGILQILYLCLLIIGSFFEKNKSCHFNLGSIVFWQQLRNIILACLPCRCPYTKFSITILVSFLSEFCPSLWWFFRSVSSWSQNWKLVKIKRYLFLQIFRITLKYNEDIIYLWV